MIKLTREKSFYQTLFKLMIPICLQNTLFMALNMCDTLMLGLLESNSEIAINAASLANQPFFIYTLFIFGIVSGSSVLISQYWGANNKKEINKVAGISLSLAVFIGVTATVLLFFFSENILYIFSKDAEVIEMGSLYLRIVIFSYIPASITSMLNGIMRSMEKVKVALFSNFVGVATNIFLNYCLIFGKFGFPALGIRGAAIATVVARILEVAIVLSYVFIIEKQVRLKPVIIFKCEREVLMHTLKISLPVIINETIWGTGVTVYAIILGNMGPIQYAAYAIAGIIERIGVVFSQGIANAGAVIIGKTIGSGRSEEAYDYSRTMLFISTLMGVVICAGIILLRGAFVGFFNVDEITKECARNIIIFVGFVILCKSYNMVSIVGVLRGGGDTKFAMYLDIIPMWFISLPLGALCATVFHFPVQYVYFMLIFPDEFIKMIIGLIRFKSKKWIRNITKIKGEYVL